MKLLKAYVRTFMAHNVIKALEEMGAPRVMAIDVKAMGDEIDHTDLGLSAEYGNTYTAMTKIEMICMDDCINRAVDIIIEKARTGHKGDGIVAVSPVEKTLKIRTGEEVCWGAKNQARGHDLYD